MKKKKRHWKQGSNHYVRICDKEIVCKETLTRAHNEYACVSQTITYASFVTISFSLSFIHIHDSHFLDCL